MDKNQVLKIIEDTGLIAIIRGLDPSMLVKVIKALTAGGVKVLEITMNNPKPLKMIEEAKSIVEDKEIVVGAGTVLDSESARAAIIAGAEFVFSPNLNLKVIELCKRYDKLVIPGVLTPTEIVNAWEKGADLIKIFPAKILGPDFIKSIMGPLNYIKIIPTGGINLDNAAEYIRAGAFALGVGKGLLSNDILENHDYKTLKDNTKDLIKVIKKVKGL